MSSWTPGRSDLVVNRLHWGLATWSLATALSRCLHGHSDLGVNRLPCGPSDLLKKVFQGLFSDGERRGHRRVLLALSTVTGDFLPGTGTLKKKEEKIYISLFSGYKKVFHK